MEKYEYLTEIRTLSILTGRRIGMDTGLLLEIGRPLSLEPPHLCRGLLVVRYEMKANQRLENARVCFDYGWLVEKRRQTTQVSPTEFLQRVVEV